MSKKSKNALKWGGITLGVSAILAGAAAAALYYTGYLATALTLPLLVIGSVTIPVIPAAVGLFALCATIVAGMFGYRRGEVERVAVPAKRLSKSAKPAAPVAEVPAPAPAPIPAPAVQPVSETAADPVPAVQLSADAMESLQFIGLELAKIAAVLERTDKRAEDAQRMVSGFSNLFQPGEQREGLFSRFAEGSHIEELGEEVVADAAANDAPSQQQPAAESVRPATPPATPKAAP